MSTFKLHKSSARPVALISGVKSPASALLNKDA